MTFPASLAIDAVFDAMGVVATYIPSGGSAATITVVRVTDVEKVTSWDHGPGVIGRASLFEIRVSEVATKPVANSTLLINGETFKLKADGLHTDDDVDRLIWTVEAPLSAA